MTLVAGVCISRVITGSCVGWGEHKRVLGRFSSRLQPVLWGTLGEGTWVVLERVVCFACFLWGIACVRVVVRGACPL